MLDRIIFVAACLFLVGILLVVGSAVPALTRRFPRAFLTGFLLAALSPVLVLVGWLLFRPTA